MVRVFQLIHLPFIILVSLLRRVDDGLNRLSRRLLPLVVIPTRALTPPPPTLLPPATPPAPAAPRLPGPTPPPPPLTHNSLIFNWALCDEVLQLLYKLLAEGRLLNGATTGRGISSDGLGESLQTASAKESMLAER